MCINKSAECVNKGVYAVFLESFDPKVQRQTAVGYEVPDVRVITECVRGNRMKKKNRVHLSLFSEL